MKLTENEASDRFEQKFGIVNAIRLMGYAYKLEAAGEDWLREKLSRQQLTFIRAQFEEAKVPWGEGAIEWGRTLKGLKKAHEDAKLRKAAKEALRALGGS